MKDRSLIPVDELNEPSIPILSSVRARNIAHAVITYCTYLDNRERQNIVSGQNDFRSMKRTACWFDGKKRHPAGGAKV